MKESKRRQIFVFTLEEKKVATFILVFFLLGLATKHYRDTHPQPAPRLTERQQYVAQRAAKAAAAQARSARGRAQAAAKPTAPETDDDDAADD